MRRMFGKLIHSERGATAVEYGLIVALIVIVVTVGIHAVGGGNTGLWGNFTARVSAAEPTS